MYGQPMEFGLFIQGIFEMHKFIILLGILMTFAFEAGASLSFDEGKAQTFCSKKWTSRGVPDREMIDYCMRQQREGYRDSVHYRSSYEFQGIPNMDEVISYALTKWASGRNYQFDMVAFEISRQAEAYLDIVYGLDNGDYQKSQISRCRNKWLKKSSPQYDMVKYCLEN